MTMEDIVDDRGQQALSRSMQWHDESQGDIEAEEYENDGIRGTTPLEEVGIIVQGLPPFVYDPPIETVVFGWGVNEDGQLVRHVCYVYLYRMVYIVIIIFHFVVSYTHTTGRDANECHSTTPDNTTHR